jgi:AraC-like DNA-binding protein
LDDIASGLLVNKISWILMCIKFTLLKDREAVIKSLTHWIDSNLYRPITVLDVARKSGYSLAYIQRNFRQECGISIGLYIRSRKLEKAAHMLRHTQLSVSDIFTMLGYEEPSTFSRAFSNQYGLSPTKYREMAKKVIHEWIVDVDY